MGNIRIHLNNRVEHHAVVLSAVLEFIFVKEAKSLMQRTTRKVFQIFFQFQFENLFSNQTWQYQKNLFLDSRWGPLLL